VNSLGGGGAERQISYISQLQEIDKILCIEPWVEYELPEEKLIFVTKKISKGNKFSKIIQVVKTLAILKKIGINKKSHLICFLQLSTLIGVLAKMVFKCKLTLSIRINPFMHGQNENAKSLSLFMLHFLFKKADYIVPNSYDTSLDIEKKFPQYKSKIKTIVNGYDIATIERNSSEVEANFETLFKNNFCLLNIGRTDTQKGQWHLLRMMQKIIDEFPHVKLIILGQGILLNELVTLSEKLKLKTYLFERDNYNENYQVYFLGFQKNPYWFYKNAKIFLFPSIYEGLPNALIESLICNTPVISADCKSGPKEIMLSEKELENNILLPMQTNYGYLMPPFSGAPILDTSPTTWIEILWYEKTKELILDANKLNIFSKNCISIREKYDFQYVQTQWKNFIAQG